MCVFRHSEPPDILKPMYLYGGVPVPQLIMERVYAAERTANEGPLLAMSKRLRYLTTTDRSMIAAGNSATDRVRAMNAMANNHGVWLGMEGDTFQQFESSLNDLDSTIFNQYQLVASAANIPSTKLLGTSPKGFNSTGEYEERNYHEDLESIQQHDLTELVEKHHQLVMKSYCNKVIETSIVWRPLDTPTAKEMAEMNGSRASTAATLIEAGVLTAGDERGRLSRDKYSPYFGLGDQDDESILSDAGLSPEAIAAAAELGLGKEPDSTAMDADFNEGDHPRDEDGKFREGSGVVSSGSKTQGHERITLESGTKYSRNADVLKRLKHQTGIDLSDKVTLEKAGYFSVKVDPKNIPALSYLKKHYRIEDNGGYGLAVFNGRLSSGSEGTGSKPAEKKPLVREPKTVEFSGKELGDIENRDIREVAKEAMSIARQKFAEKTFEATDGQAIKVTWQNIKHGLSADANPTKVIAATKLDEIIKNAEYVKPLPKDKPRPGVKASHLYKTATKINRRNLTIGMVVQQRLAKGIYAFRSGFLGGVCIPSQKVSPKPQPSGWGLASLPP